ncbi:hypothetical protein MKX78_10880 [Cytobacillus sp. FSL R5-0569]|uniref:hypothetical protein n=1 Tax=Cytobacillus sp. FSL R5-0569 TaxID=2921649 RepID=UPI0030F560B5
MIDFSKYHINITEEEVKLTAKERNENGFLIHVSFGRDEEKGKDAVEAIEDFFIREIFKS